MMRRMKIYNAANSDPRFRCFGCCHVRTGTIFIGFYHLTIQTIAIFAVLCAISRPQIFWEVDGNEISKSNDMTGKTSNANANVTNKNKVTTQTLAELPELPTPLLLKSGQPMDDSGFAYVKSDVTVFTRKRLQNGDAHLALALLVGLFLLTAMLLHGVAKNRPSYLLPFFCFQVFDLVLACLTAVGHYAWLPDLQQILADNPDLPYRSQLMNVNSQWLALCVLTVYVIVLFAKAYFIGVVWACYQYLHLRQASVMTYTVTEDGQHREDGELLLPPDYESALNMPKSGTPPPPYGVA